MVQSARVSQQQFQQLCQTRDEAKALKAEVARFRKATKRGEDIPTVAEERIAKHKKDSEESAKKMVKEIEVLKRAREQDRKKYGRELRQNKEAIRKAKEEIEMGKEIIKAKEREIREHAVAAKKLKRQLRDLIGGMFLLRQFKSRLGSQHQHVSLSPVQEPSNTHQPRVKQK